MNKFQQLRELARYTRNPDAQHKGRELLIRFLDGDKAPAEYAHIVDSLCIHFGLFPYVGPNREALSTAEALALETHRPPVNVYGESFIFHSDQAVVFHRLMDGENVMLSAPTSFGKSAILDALIATNRWNNIVVIVPTIALIDEIRRRLVRFRDRYTLITHPSQEIGARNVYVLTQERFLELPQKLEVNLFMIDEFYKLSSFNQDDQRMSMLNIAWKQLRDSGAQFYLTGPNIDALDSSLSEELRESLYVSRYSTVAVDVEDRSHVSDDERIEDMAATWGSLDGPTLLFVSSPSRAERTAIAVSDFESLRTSTVRATKIADWLGENFHPQWRVVEALKKGVAVHTGPMPRSLQRIMVRLFAEADVLTLVCTTTLIEGVNTSAKNVIIFDKKIDRKPIDYFTFSNVRGRAGRMSNHFVGRVITYMPPPQHQLTEVDIPIESQSPSAPLSSLIQVPSDDLSKDSRQRLNDVIEQHDLSVRTIQVNRGYDPERQIEVAKLLRKSSALRAQFSWKGYPTKKQAREVLKVGIELLLLPKQRRGMSVDRLMGILNAVRETQGDLKALVDRQIAFKFPTEDLSDVVANVLAFQRNWMGFTIPSFLRALQLIYNEVAASLGEPAASFEHYVAQIEHLFLDANLLDFDEYGLPLPLALRFSELGMSRSADFSVVLCSFMELAKQPEIRAQLSDVELWIVDDVLSGLGV